MPSLCDGVLRFAYRIRRRAVFEVLLRAQQQEVEPRNLDRPDDPG